MRHTKMDVPELEEYVATSTSYAEVLRKLGYKPVSGNFGTLKRLLVRKGFDVRHFQLSYHKVAYTNAKGRPLSLANETLFVVDSDCHPVTVRKRVLRDKLLPYVCAVCDMIPVWCNKPLVLVLDHINGVNNDHRLSNLRWLCPNCNAQTPTFSRGANRRRLK